MAVIIKCERCGKEKRVYPFQIRMGRGRFCSVKCSSQQRPRVPKGLRVKCEKCGKDFLDSPSRFGKRKFCSQQCYYDSMKGPERKLHPSGYVMVRVPGHPHAYNGGFVLEHVLVVEKRIGRYLQRPEQVHHANEIKTDNHDLNLILCANAKEHRAQHRRSRVLRAGGNPDTDRYCTKCRKAKLSSDFVSSSNPYCRDCYRKYRSTRGL